MGKKGSSAKKSPKLKAPSPHAQLVREMIAAMAPFAIACAETAAMMGAAKNKKPGNLSAAKTVMDFIANHSEPGGDSEVADLLKEMREAQNLPSSLDDELPFSANGDEETGGTGEEVEADPGSSN